MKITFVVHMQYEQPTEMIEAKTRVIIGNVTPVMMAQIVPTKIYGHSVMLRWSTSKNDTGGTFSSCKKNSN